MSRYERTNAFQRMSLKCTEIYHVMKFGYFTPYQKTSKYSTKNCGWETSSRPFYIYEKLHKALSETKIFKTYRLY